jgi:hypothetical protein
MYEKYDRLLLLFNLRPLFAGFWYCATVVTAAAAVVIMPGGI